MYEIWLAMNIVWEIALTLWPLLLGAMVLWIVLMAMAARRAGTRWGAGAVPALFVGVLVAAAAFLLVPGGSRSSLGELRYWVDWANLLAVAAGFGSLAALAAWPLTSMWKRAGMR